MKKIPTLFVRDRTDGVTRFVTHEVTPGCNWVLDGLGVATRKWDGTCVRWHEGEWWVRRSVKAHRSPPVGFIELDFDTVTCKRYGWEPAQQSGRWPAIQQALGFKAITCYGTDATFELVGPSVNGNPENFQSDTLVEHGYDIKDVSDRSYEGILAYLTRLSEMEGLVFYRTERDPNSGMVKIKRSDFKELAK